MSKKRTALDGFLESKAEIDAIVDYVSVLSDNHFNIPPNEIHWGHVGRLANYANLLKRITDSTFIKKSTPTVLPELRSQ